MTITDHISQLAGDRQQITTTIHELILKNDPNVEAVVGTMMRAEMIIYNQRNYFKYGLANAKDHLTLHVLPIYANAPLHAKYVQLLPGARFQKGCVNFKNVTEFPLHILEQLIKECSIIDLLAEREKQLANKKKK
jgi:hypothetical protein